MIEVEGLDGDISIMPFNKKIIIKGDFQKEVPYSVKVSKGIKSVSGNELNEDYTRYNLYVGKKTTCFSICRLWKCFTFCNNKKSILIQLILKK